MMDIPENSVGAMLRAQDEKIYEMQKAIDLMNKEIEKLRTKTNNLDKVVVGWQGQSTPWEAAKEAEKESK